MQPWPVQKVESWQHFEEWVGGMLQIGHGPHRMFVFRGQSQCWNNLQPTLARILTDASLNDENGLQLEDVLLEHFSAQAHLYLDSTEVVSNNTPIEWWSVMQHFRSPTRLLDWTESPYVAAWFTVITHDDKDGELWAVSHVAVNAEFPQVDLNTHDFTRHQDTLQFSRSGRQTEREAAQNSWFSIAMRPGLDHADLISLALHENKKCELPMYRKFIVPSSLKAEFRERLYFRNITARTLFPGIEGLGNSMRELATMTARHMQRAVEAATPKVP